MDPCPRCGLSPGELRDGYASPEDLGEFLERCPPPLIAAFVRLMRRHEMEEKSGGCALWFNGPNGELRNWRTQEAYSQEFPGAIKKRA